MKQIAIYTALLVLLISCTQDEERSSINSPSWKNKVVSYQISDSLVHGISYLSVYSQIYSQTEHRTHNLTATISLRNPYVNDTIYVEKAEYFNTQGKSIRTYFNQPIFSAPMETVEIVIDEEDQEGGTGANFLFNWKTKQLSHEPLFEAVMISTYGQQGLSFSTRGVRVE